MVLVDSELVLLAWKFGWLLCALTILLISLAMVMLSNVYQVELISEYVKWKVQRDDLKKELELR